MHSFLLLNIVFNVMHARNNLYLTLVLGMNRCPGVNNYSSERIPQIAVDSHTAQPRARYVIVHGAAIPVYNVIESSAGSTTPKFCSVAVLCFKLAKLGRYRTPSMHPGVQMPG